MTVNELVNASQWARAHFGGRAELVKNRVGNLSILDDDGEYVGFIDLGNGEVHIMEFTE